MKDSMYKILLALSFPLCMIAAEGYLEGDWHMVQDVLPVVTHYSDSSNGYEGYMTCSKGTASGNQLNLAWIARRSVVVAVVQTSLATQHVYMNAYKPPVYLRDKFFEQYGQYKKLAAWWSRFKDRNVLEKQLFVFMPSYSVAYKDEWRKYHWKVDTTPRATEWSATLSRALEVKDSVVLSYTISSYGDDKSCRDGIDHVVVQTSTNGTTIRCQQSVDFCVEDKWIQKIHFLEDRAGI